MKQTNPVGKRRPKNPHEATLFDIMKADGWEVTKQGFPDFACFRNGEFCIIEVKPKRSHKLKRMQYKVMLALAEAGVKAYRWTPDNGFEFITPATAHI